MDTSVALVEAYLQVNGYFTVTEYPILSVIKHQTRTVTDMDVIAFRFPGAGREVVRQRGGSMFGPVSYETDPNLGAPAGHADMILGEVKESAASFNDASDDAGVFAASLARFGCCNLEDSIGLAQDLLRYGHIQVPAGHVVRLVTFGSSEVASHRNHCHFVSHGHILGFLREYLSDHWSQLRHAQFKNPIINLLALEHKSAVAEP